MEGQVYQRAIVMHGPGDATPVNLGCNVANDGLLLFK